MLTEACPIRLPRIDGTPMPFGDMPDAYRRGAYHTPDAASCTASGLTNRDIA
jgi:hypothetical protein